MALDSKYTCCSCVHMQGFDEGYNEIDCSFLASHFKPFLGRCKYYSNGEFKQPTQSEPQTGPVIVLGKGQTGIVIAEHEGSQALYFDRVKGKTTGEQYDPAEANENICILKFENEAGVDALICMAAEVKRRMAAVSDKTYSN